MHIITHAGPMHNIYSCYLYLLPTPKPLIALYPAKAVVMRTNIQESKIAVLFYADKSVAAYQVYFFAVFDPVFTVPCEPVFSP